MNNGQGISTLGGTTTRRRAITGIAVALANLAGASRILGAPQQATMSHVPSSKANEARTSLHQEVDFGASPERIYEILLDSKQFAMFTGLKADIDPKPGGAFSMFGGLIVGRNVELVPHERIVQAWRPTHWDPGIYSIVRFELKANGAGTRLVLDHTGFPAGEFDHLDPGWKQRYWDPLKKYLA